MKSLSTIALISLCLHSYYKYLFIRIYCIVEKVLQKAVCYLLY